MTAVVTGVSLPEPPDPPDPPDVTSSFTISSTSVCFLTISPTSSDLDLKNWSLFKKEKSEIDLIVVFVRLLTAVCRFFFTTPYMSFTPFQSVVTHRHMPLTSHGAVSCQCLPPPHAVHSHFIRESEARLSLTFTTFPLNTSTPIPLTLLQVIDLNSISIMIASLSSYECFLVPCSSTHLAFVQVFTAVCSLYSGLSLVNDSLKLFPHHLWQRCKELLVISIFLVIMACFSFMEHVCLPYFPLGWSGYVAGSKMSETTFASMFDMSKGSSIWCSVAYNCEAKFMIVKSALIAVSVPGIRSLIVFSNSQSLISLISTIGVEFRGRLCDCSCCLCVMLALIIWFCISYLHFAFVAVDVLACLALLLFDVNTLSYGD